MASPGRLSNLIAATSATCLALLLGAAPETSDAGPAVRPVIVGEGSSPAMAGHYIVKVADPSSGRPDVNAIARVLGRQYHGNIGHIWGNGLDSFSVAMPEADARKLSMDRRVAYVEQDQRWTVAASQTNPPNWGLDRIDQRKPTNAFDVQYNYPDTAGTGVHVYVVDTGVMKGHTDFGGRVTYGKNFINDGQADTDASDCGLDPTKNGTGHGTAVAGIIGGTKYGVAKNVQMIAVRVFDCQGTTDTTSIEDGLNWVIGDVAAHQVQGDWRAVINLSLGPACVGGPCPAGSDKAIIDAVNKAIAAGIPVVAAAGNENQDACNDPVPAVLPAITVGAVDQNDARWFDTSTHASNYGSCVDIWAPGASIETDWNRNSTDSNVFSGTSMAVPFVTGAIALLWALPDARPDATPAQFSNQLVTTATQGKLTGLGAGSPNLLLFTRAALASTGPSVALAREADGRLALFGVSPESRLLFWRDQTTANSQDWGPWTHSVTGGWLSVGAQADGNQRIEVDALTVVSGPVWHRQQAGQNSTEWNNWHPLDGLLASVAATLRTDGRLEMFGIDQQGQVRYRSQTSRGSIDWQPWQDIPLSGFSPIRAISAETYADGRRVLFMVDSEGTAWRAMPPKLDDEIFGSVGRMDAGPSSDPSLMSEVAAARNNSGALELIGTDGHGGIFHATETGPATFLWSSWAPLPGTKILRHIAAETNKNGTVCVVGVDNNGDIWQATQTAPDSPSYTPWTQIDGKFRV